MERSYRVLVADDDFVLTQRLREFLVEKGFEVKVANNGRACQEIVREWSPHFVLIDLILPEGGAIQLLDLIKTDPVLKKTEIKVLVTSSHNSVQNVKTVLTAGASDYVIRPFRFEDIVQRIIFHTNAKRQVSENDAQISSDKDKKNASDTYLQLVDLVLREASVKQPVQATLYSLTRMLAMALKAVRCSVIQCELNELKGSVLASSDDKDATGIQLDLNRYPEVMHVMSTEKIVVIENMDYDPVLAEIKKQIKNISFNSMIVCPVRCRGEFFGVISARMSKESQILGDNEIRFARLVSYVAGLVVERISTSETHSATKSA